MKLCFLGQTYFVSNNMVDTVETENTACFRGQRYALRRPVQSFNLESRPSIRIYRGVVYGAE